MGSTDSIPETNFLKLNRINWEYVPQLFHSPQSIETYNGVLLKNKMTGQQLQQYDIYIRDKEQHTLYQYMLTFRNQNESLVPISYINQETSRKLCSLIYHLKVYIEPIPMRLYDFKIIRFPQNLYLLLRALTGFKVLYDKIGNFLITEELVCINQEGIVRIWLSPNLSQYMPILHNEYGSLKQYVNKTEEENEMVWQIIIMIDKITQKQYPPKRKTFTQYLQKNINTQLNFNKAIQLLQSYARQYKIMIPQIFQSAIKKIRQKKGIFDSQIDIIDNNVKLNQSQLLDSIYQNKNYKQSQVKRIQIFDQQSKFGYHKNYDDQLLNKTFTQRFKQYGRNIKSKDGHSHSNTQIKQSIIEYLHKKQKSNVNFLSMNQLQSPQNLTNYKINNDQINFDTYQYLQCQNQNNKYHIQNYLYHNNNHDTSFKIQQYSNNSHKPSVVFTYQNYNQVGGYQPHINNDISQCHINNCTPISPPSGDSISVLKQNTKRNEQQKKVKQAQQLKQKYPQSIVNPQIKTECKNKNIRQFKQKQFMQKYNQIQQIYLRQLKKSKKKSIQKIVEVQQKLQQSKCNQQSKISHKKKTNQFYHPYHEHPSTQYLRLSTSNTNNNSKTFSQNIPKNNMNDNQKNQVIQFLQHHQLSIDPDIMADLIKYQKNKVKFYK